MSKRSLLPQSRRHIFVYDEDWEFLVAVYTASTGAISGPSQAIREIIHSQVGKIRAKSEEAIDAHRRAQSENGEPQ